MTSATHLLHSVWTEKYRPSKIADCILPKSTFTEFTGFIKKGHIPNLLLSGPAGSGKTTAAMALCSELEYDTLIINCSNEGRLIDTLRSKIASFVTSMSLSGNRKAVILDEADGLPNEIQLALRNFTEEFSSNAAFILTCNFPNRIIEALHSRCAVIDFTIPKAERQDLIVKLFMRISGILSSEGVSFDKQVLAVLIGKYFPDIRRLLNELQRKGVNGDINSGSLTGSTGTDIDELVAFLKDKNFREVRKWVASTPNLDISHVSRELYNKMYDICVHEDMPALILLLSQYQYRDAFVADKEINMMALMVEIMTEVRFK